MIQGWAGGGGSAPAYRAGVAGAVDDDATQSGCAPNHLPRGVLRSGEPDLQPDDSRPVMPVLLCLVSPPEDICPDFRQCW